MTEATKTDNEIMSFKDFLEQVPPYQKVTIEDLAVKALYDDITKPEIQAFCDSEECGDIRYFDCDDSYSSLSNNEITIVGLRYCCRNCQQGHKWFALLTLKTQEGRSGYAIKLGEWPQFGAPVSKQALSLIESDREIFSKGKTSEDHGFGIGAFAYYRAVVENQWQHLIDEMIKVLTHLKKQKAKIETFKKAKSESRFENAVTALQDEIPESLLIAGHHNPLELLYKITSVNADSLSDSECLKRAKSIRLILSELADKLANAMKDNSELKGALTELFDSDKSSDSPHEQ